MNHKPLLIDWIANDPNFTRATHELIRSAPRFRVEGSTAELLVEIAGKKDIQESARYVFWPGEATWLEMKLPAVGLNCEVGLLFKSRTGSLVEGDIALCCIAGTDAKPRSSVETAFLDCNLKTPPFITLAKRPQPSPFFSHIWSEDHPDSLMSDLRRVIIATLCLLSSPGRYELREVDFNRLNRARARSGKWPLLAYKEVRIAIAGTPPTVTPASGHGAARALHWVRAHLRLYRGKVILVSPHWRGDPQLGVKRPAYVITP